MSILFRFAGEIYHARRDRGITQEEAAEALNISLRWYQKIERGQSLPGTKLALRIIAFFEIEGSRLKAPKSVSISNG